MKKAFYAFCQLLQSIQENKNTLVPITISLVKKGKNKI
jgi:hypothetical protein